MPTLTGTSGTDILNGSATNLNFTLLGGEGDDVYGLRASTTSVASDTSTKSNDLYGVNVLGSTPAGSVTITDNGGTGDRLDLEDQQNFKLLNTLNYGFLRPAGTSDLLLIGSTSKGVILVDVTIKNFYSTGRIETVGIDQDDANGFIPMKIPQLQSGQSAGAFPVSFGVGGVHRAAAAAAGTSSLVQQQAHSLVQWMAGFPGASAASAASAAANVQALSPQLVSPAA